MTDSSRFSPLYMIDSWQLRPLHDGHLGGNTGQRGARRLRTFDPFPLARSRSRRPGTPPGGTPARPQAQSGPDVRVEEPDEGQQPRFGHAQHHARSPRDVRELAAPAFSRVAGQHVQACLLYTSPSPRDDNRSRMPSSA